MNYLRQKLLNWALRNILKAVTFDEVLRFDQSGVYFGNQRLIDEQIREFAHHAKVIKGLTLWATLTQTLKHSAQYRIFESSTNYEEVLSGKLMIYNLDILEKTLDALSEYK